MIRLTYPDIDTKVLAKIEEAISTGWLVSGKNVKSFEEKIAHYIRCKYAVAVSSGTAALHLSLLALGIKAGDEVIVPDFTFPAPANMVEVIGAKAVLADIATDTFNIAVAEIENKITEKTKAIIPIDQFGNPAEIDTIAKIAEKHNLTLIEDAACALGAEYKGKKCGSFGLACLSFHPRKIITTGEGGMILTNDSKVAEECSKLRNHGIQQINSKRVFEKAGYNYRMGEINAAIGLEQMERLEQFIAKRRELAKMLSEALATVTGITTPTEKKGCKHIYQSYVVMLDKRINRDKVVDKLRKAGVEATQGADAIHMQPYYAKKYGYKPGQLQSSAFAAQHSIALPMHTRLAEEDIRTITTAVTAAVNESR